MIHQKFLLLVEMTYKFVRSYNKMNLNIITSFSRLYNSSKPFKALIFDDGFIVCKGITVIENS